MKTSVLFGLLTVLVASQSALACPHSRQQFICPGDPVVDTQGNTGTVVGINVSQGEASVKYQNIYMSNSVLPIESLALGLGCVGSICVGDRATDQNGNPARVIGVNPYSYTVALQFDNEYMSNVVISMELMSLGYGCMGWYCVSDRVVDTNGAAGHIVAINYVTKQVAVTYENPYMSGAVLSVQQLALGLGCVAGNCVNDRGSDAQGNPGTVIAVNPFNANLAIQYDNEYMSNALISASQFMSSEYCATYGDADRSVPSFFETHGNPGRISVYSNQNANGGFYFSPHRLN